MADLKLRDVKKAYGNLRDPARHRPRHQVGRVHRLRRPLGLRQVDACCASIAGLEEITSGTLQIAGEVVNDVPPSKRGIAMVFQSYALYPHMTVYDNMAFGMKIAGESKDEIDRRVQAGGRHPAARPNISSACPRRCRAASASASPSAAPSCATPRSSCSTSRCPTSTRRCASPPASRSPSSRRACPTRR